MSPKGSRAVSSIRSSRPTQKEEFEHRREIDFALRHRGSGALPVELLLPARDGRDGDPPRSARRACDRGPEPPADRRAARPSSARAGPRDRDRRQRQEHDARVDDRLDQPPAGPKNIVTIEDPIEFLHRDDKSLISQREVGLDTESFSDALRHILRQDPDVILLGEIRDRRHDVDRADGGGHRAPRPLDPAHDRRRADGEPDHLVLPAAPARRGPLPPRDHAAGGHLPAADPARERQGARAGRGGHGQHADDPGVPPGLRRRRC